MSWTISGILYQVSVIMVNYRSHDPHKTNPGQYALDKSFRDLYKGYKDEDVALQYEHTIPNTTIQWLAQRFKDANVHLHTTSALIVVAFFFML